MNPYYKKVSKVERGRICLVLSANNKLGDLVIHNFVSQQLELNNYSVTYGLSKSFFDRYNNFFQDHSIVNDFFVLPANKWQWLPFIVRLRKEKITAVILDERALMGPFFFYLAGVPVIITPKRTRNVFSTQEYSLDKLSEHYTSYFASLLNLLRKDVTGKKEHVVAPFFPFKQQDTDGVRTGKGVVLSVHLGGGNYWHRRWPADRYLALCKLFLQHYNGRVLLVGGKEEYAENEELKNALAEECNAYGKIINFCGSDLNTMANVISSSNVFVGNDSGPLHIANALNTRVIGIYGPSPIAVFNPTTYDCRNATIHADMDCIGCNNFNNICKLAEGKKFSCLTEVTAESVWKKLRAMLDEEVKEPLSVPSLENC